MSDLFNVDDLEVEVLETRYEMSSFAATSTCTGPPKLPPSTCVVIQPPPSTCQPF